MSKYEIRKEIAALINSIKEHSDSIGNTKYIPQLELEAILHKIEKLYEKSIVFNYLNSLPEESEPEKPVVAEPIPKVVEQKEEVIKEEKMVSVETISSPDILGSELPPVIEKPKEEKREEKNPEKSLPKITKPPITDIKNAIGINDKFQFTNELFEGNANEYSIAIQQLNSSNTLESAVEYFNSLQSIYKWDVENETVKRLFDLVNRRFS